MTFLEMPVPENEPIRNFSRDWTQRHHWSLSATFMNMEHKDRNIGCDLQG